MNMNARGVRRRKDAARKDVKSRIISRQSDEIDALKKKISELEIESSEKDELVASIDSLLEDLRVTVDIIKDKSDEYDDIVHELRNMKKIIDEDVFNKKWWIIKYFLR